MKIAIAQFDFPVGDLVGNLALARQCIDDARAAGADLIMFPEMAVSGYPPEDLLLRPGFMQHCHAVLDELVQGVHGIDVVIGHPWQEGLSQGGLSQDKRSQNNRSQDNRSQTNRSQDSLSQHNLSQDGISQDGISKDGISKDGMDRYNAVSWIRDGEVLGRYFKQRLPNYDVFDERRYFTAGTEPLVVEIKGCKVGVLICEDSWVDGPAVLAKNAGAELLLLANSSPYHDNKLALRRQMLQTRLDVCGLPMVYCNLVSGQDELVFDGRSMLMSAAGQVSVFAPVCEEKLLFAEFDRDSGRLEYVSAETFFDQKLITGGDGEHVIATIYAVLVRGLRDYVTKNGFTDVAIGLSGGIDSALVLALAVDAFGADRVHAVMMPSRHTSQLSLDLAREQAEMLGVSYESISIEPAFEALVGTLEQSFAGREPDVTEENLQARIRGNILMAMSNKFGWMVLATGNKSELAVGYSTIYGDMCGGFAPIKDCLKTRVNALCVYRNTISPAVPQAVIDRPPSAELAPGQLDQDSLPEYEVLDQILAFYVEQDWSISDIVAAGFDEDVVRRVAALVLRNEYKRRQGAPGVRVTSKSFGRDRRYPITSGWREESLN